MNLMVLIYLLVPKLKLIYLILNRKILILLLVIIFTRCSVIDNHNKVMLPRLIKEIDIEKIIKSRKKIAFIRGNYDNSMISDERKDFGDIFIYNIDDSSLHRLTDNKYFEAHLSWSPQGDKILFTSTRDKIYSFEEPQKDIFADLFVFDLFTNSIVKLNPSNFEVSKFLYYSNIFWAKNGIYIGDEREIYLLDNDGLESIKILTIESDYLIRNFILTKDEKYLVIDCQLNYQFKKFLKRIAIYDLAHKQFYWVTGDQEIVALKGHGPGQESIVYFKNDSLFTYNFLNKSVVPVHFQEISDSIIVNSFDFINNDEIIFNSFENAKFKGKSIRETNMINYIGFYNIKDRLIKYISLDNKAKDYISIFVN